MHQILIEAVSLEEDEGEEEDRVMLEVKVSVEVMLVHGQGCRRGRGRGTVGLGGHAPGQQLDSPPMKNWNDVDEHNVSACYRFEPVTVLHILIIL